MNLLTSGQARAFEALVRERLSITERELISRAGLAAARWIEARVGPLEGRGVAVLCGKGNNAADGLVLARELAERGALVSALLAFAEPDLGPEARHALGRFRDAPGAQVPSGASAEEALRGADLAVDALVGTGARLPLTGPLAEWVLRLAEFRGRVFALDLPSGLDPDSGRVQGPAVRADWTLCFLAPKLGLVLGRGPGHSGAWGVAGLGAPSEWAPAGPSLFDAGAARAALLPRPWDDHKKKAELLVVAGSRDYAGAALLCARAACRGGAGMVRLAVPEGLVARVQIALPEAVVAGLPGDGAFDAAALAPALALAGTARAVVVGPGLGRSPGAADFVDALWSGLTAPALFDADALHALKPGRLPGGPRVLTPHEGELKAMLGPQALDAGRLRAALALASGFHAVALLKGPATLVADLDGVVSVNAGAGPLLATAGSGDVLSGLIGALLARGHAPAVAAALGAWVHGRAAVDWARAHGGADRGLLASDLAEALPSALATLSGRGPDA